MPLHSLQLTNFRCFPEAELALDPQLTLVTGPNGAGKSSVLEAIYLLGRGRSFRTPHARHLIRAGAPSALVVGQAIRADRPTPVGIELSDDRVQARIGGCPAETLAELTTVLPVQVIEPGIHKLIEEGPLRRRRFLDWGVFHVEPGYLRQWQRFHRAVRQRNAALREGQAPDDVLDAWDLELAASGEAVASARGAYVELLRPHVAAATEALLAEPIDFHYSRGWSAEESLHEALIGGRERDRRRGSTMVGPHRSDLSLRRLSSAAKHTVSRGQQKLLAAALVLAQLRHHADQGLGATLLLDDPAAELDAERMDRLVGQVRQLPVQLVITALQDDFRALGAAGRLFHVEPGGKVRLL